jgi:hypothetical protein
MGVRRFALLTAFSASLLMGQPDPASPTFAMTPAAVAAGTPDGVAILSPHETVNVFNGNLSFVVPLHDVSGRGKAGYTTVIPIGTKWTIENDMVQKRCRLLGSRPKYDPRELYLPRVGRIRGQSGSNLETGYAHRQGEYLYMPNPRHSRQWANLLSEPDPDQDRLDGAERHRARISRCYQWRRSASY